MDCTQINKTQREKMKRITSNTSRMNWEDPQFYEILLGKIPKLRHYQNESDIQNELSKLEKLLSSYDYFSMNRAKFLECVKSAIGDIQIKRPNWYGVNEYEVEEALRQQEFCLVSGEGGIGKSYFVMCLEDELEKSGVPHLCVYGKFLKDMAGIEASEIIKNNKNGFIFIVDAINELSELGQETLINIIETLREYKSIRILITYRTNAIDGKILAKFQEMAKAEYSFPGVSFESALAELLKSSAPDVYKYEDILYSNNALLLSMLCDVLSDEKLIGEHENSIASVTFILERYIKKSIKRTFKGEIPSEAPTEIWRDIKRIAKWMYEHDSKEIDEKALINVINTSNTGKYFINVMMQAGFLGIGEHDGNSYYYFSIDTLTDFLIARSLFDDIMSKDFEDQAKIISRKVHKLYGLEEAIIIALFDSFSPDYQYIARLLSKAGLSELLRHETLIKVNFNKDHIGEFLQVFDPTDKPSLLAKYGGYTDKPFNCVNFLNSYYKADTHQLKELSMALSGSHSLGNVKGRLKNMLYFITLNNDNSRRYEEAFYFAMWCSAAPNNDIRHLATKLLYEIGRLETKYKNKLIAEYDRVIDPYIKESIIFTLANYPRHNVDIETFFRGIIVREDSLSAKSIKRIAVYLGDAYGYIQYLRENLYDPNAGESISDTLNEILFRVDLHNKDYLPFHYWGKDNVNMRLRFLNVDKWEVMEYNRNLEKTYSCVRTGKCNGYMGFENCVGADRYKNTTLDMGAFFCSFERVIEKIFNMFGEGLQPEKTYLMHTDFTNSFYMKCVDTATGIFFGSLMCNYYTDEFATYNNSQNSIGFQVYDPIAYDEDIFIATPIPIYQPFVENLGDAVINRLELPDAPNQEWAKDANLTRKNLLTLLLPVETKGVQWVLLAAGLRIRNEDNGSSDWIDTYDLYCCTSDKETIRNDGQARYLTIELEEFTGNIDEYSMCVEKPWLCKSVRSIAYNSDVFDDVVLTLPPAELIDFFQLKPVYTDMSWVNGDNEQVIICNNNKSSYYQNPITGTVFIRKDYLDKYLENHTLKYFAFSERYTEATGHPDETSLHFEIKDAKICKEIPNNSDCDAETQDVNPECACCPHGFIDRRQTDNSEFSLDDLLVSMLSEYLPDEE